MFHRRPLLAAAVLATVLGLSLLIIALLALRISATPSDTPSATSATLAPLAACCGSEAACARMVDEIQIQGTQEAYLRSLILLNKSLEVHTESADLWGMLGKLHVFYLFQWSVAGPAIQRALGLDNSSVNAHLFRAWLASTPPRRDATASEADFQAAMRLSPTGNFWPPFEYATWLSHVGGRFEESRRQYESVAAASAENPFWSFFYGLLLKHHLSDASRGEAMIEKAKAVASALPGQAASNLAFQAALLAAAGRRAEAVECCAFSAAILDPTVTPASVVCSSSLAGGEGETVI